MAGGIILGGIGSAIGGSISDGIGGCAGGATIGAEQSRPTVPLPNTCSKNPIAKGPLGIPNFPNYPYPTIGTGR